MVGMGEINGEKGGCFGISKYLLILVMNEKKVMLVTTKSKN